MRPLLERVLHGSRGSSTRQHAAQVRSWRRSRLVITVATLALAAVMLVGGAGAAAGDLDPSFGAGGKVLTDLGGSDVARAVALQPDGRLVAAGWEFSGGAFALVRYDADGRLDSSFGTGGIVRTDIGLVDRAQAVALQPDGRIVAAGFTCCGERKDDFAVVRYNADGSLDSSFGSGGIVLTDFGDGIDVADGVAVQPDGRLVAAGTSIHDPDSLYSNFALARYNADGSLDSSFGVGGKVLTDFFPIEEAHAVALQPDGRIVVAGGSQSCCPYDFTLVRYNADGSLDEGFGSGGIVVTEFGDGCHDEAFAVGLQRDGRIVAAGFGACSFDFALARYHADGSLDPSFGSGGLVLTDVGGDVDGASAVAVQRDGRIVAAGDSSVGGFFDFALVRYNLDGSLDSAFGAGGKVLTDFGGEDFAFGLALQPDGRIVAAGVGAGDFALARYQACLLRPWRERGC